MTVFIDEDISGFYVPVDHAGLLGGLKPSCHLQGDVDDFFFGKGTSFAHDTLKAFAFE